MNGNLTSTVLYEYSLTDLFQNGHDTMYNWVGGFICIIGILALGFGVYRVFRDLTTNQPGQTPHWLKNFCIILFGGLCSIWGIGWISQFSKDAKTNVDELFQGSGGGTLKHEGTSALTDFEKDLTPPAQFELKA